MAAVAAAGRAESTTACGALNGMEGETCGGSGENAITYVNQPTHYKLQRVLVIPPKQNPGTFHPLTSARPPASRPLGQATGA